MTSKERIAVALKGGIPDRVPVVNIFNMNYLVQELKSTGETFDRFNQANLEKIIRYQENVGHDPVYYLHTFQEPEMVKLPESFMKWNPEDTQTWQIRELPAQTHSDEKVVKRVYTTPQGKMEALLKRTEYQAWILEHPLKDKTQIELLPYRCAPEKMDASILEALVKNLGDKGFFAIGVPSVWQEGCALRGFDKMIYDVSDDPQWVHEFFQVLAEYAVRVVHALGKAGVDSVFINESYVGIGMSGKMYREMVLPYDRKMIAAAEEHEMISSLHICGKCNALLEDMAESGATCLEPLVPVDYSGNVDLADAKRRVGAKVGIWGGLKERVLSEDKPAVKQEVLRCLEAAGEGGGYVLRGSGQIYDAKQDNLRYLRDLAEQYGTY